MDDPLHNYRLMLAKLRDLQNAGVTLFPQVTVPLPQQSRQHSDSRENHPNAQANPSGPTHASSGATAADRSEPHRSDDYRSAEHSAAVSGNPDASASRQTLHDQWNSAHQASLTPAAPHDASAGAVPEDLTRAPLREVSDLDDASRQLRLSSLAKSITTCTHCPQLVENRTQTVFGVGPVRPRLCFFGEGPGADEDRLGEPFVGRAGQLLNKIIAAMTLAREDVYILNAVKCRPPGNRNPTTDELACCRPHWVEQLEILRPEFICCLGGVAANTLLNNPSPVGRLRHRWHRYRDTPVIVTYHPAYLLRNEFAKRYVWDDVKMLMSEMGLQRDG